MAIYGVEASNVPPPRKRRTQIPDTEAVKKVQQSLKASQEANEQLLTSVAAANDRIQAFNDFLDQFQEILDLDRDGIQAAAKELGLEIKGNTADRDVLSMIFQTMREKMLSDEE